MGNIPLQAREQSLKKIFGTFGRICRVELIKKPAPYRRCRIRFWWNVYRANESAENQIIAFAFIEYSTAEEAASATQGVFMLLGSRLRVQQKENLYLNTNRFGHAFTHTRPMANRFNPNDEAISMVFQRGVSVGMAKATNFQGAGVAQSGIPPPAIQYPLNSQFFGRQNPPLSQGAYAQYPFYPSPPIFPQVLCHSARPCQTTKQKFPPAFVCQTDRISIHPCKISIIHLRLRNICTKLTFPLVTLPINGQSPTPHRTRTTSPS